jgi:glycosyltransferase 2 family protein
MTLLWKTLLGAAGLALFGWYLAQAGLDEVWAAIVKIGPYAPLLLLPYFVVYLVDCLAWSRTLPPHHIPFLRLLRIRWAGESVNNLVPSAYVGGEAVKVLLLRDCGIAATDGASSAVISKTAQSLAQMIFVVLASGFLFYLAGDTPALRAGLATILVLGILALAFLLAIQRMGAYRAATALVRVLPFAVPAIDKRKEKLQTLDRAILAFYRERPGSFYRSTALYFCGWLLDTVEIYLVAYLLGLPISWTQALVVEAFAGVAKALGMWIPGSLGVQESGIVLVGRLAGIPETLGAAYALIRRARELVFAAIGLSFVYASQWRRAKPAVSAAKI